MAKSTTGLGRPQPFTARAFEGGFGPTHPAPAFNPADILGFNGGIKFNIDKFSYGELLPNLSKERLVTLHEIATSLNPQVLYAQKRLNERLEEYENLSNRLEVLDREITLLRKEGSNTAELDTEKKAITLEFEKATESLSQQKLKYTYFEERWINVMRLIDGIKTWLTSLPRNSFSGEVEFEFVEKSIEQPKKKSTIEQIREFNFTLQEQRKEIENAPIHSEIAIDRAEEEVDRMARACEQDVIHLLKGTGKLSWPNIPNDSSIIKNTTGVDVSLALMAFTHREAFLEAIKQKILFHANDELALSDDDRKTKITEIDDKIEELERLEAEMLFEEPLQAPFRSNQSPQAVLGVSVNYLEPVDIINSKKKGSAVGYSNHQTTRIQITN